MKARVTPKTKQVRFQDDSYEKLHEISMAERRPMTDQISLIVDLYYAEWRKKR